MERRLLGRTGLSVSALGFGCGNVGGLMIRGTHADRQRAVARALDLGISYFDTAAMYGDGQSETNLGRVLANLKPDVIVASKVRVARPSSVPLARQIADSAEASLRRLQRDHVDVFQLHTPTMLAPGHDELDVRTVLEDVVPAFERLRAEGKIRFSGFSGTGDPQALPALIDGGAFDVAQLIYNLLNPSAGGPTPPRSAGPDYGNLLARARQQRMGAVAIRVLAGGALSGTVERHPIASGAPAPMGSSTDYRADVEAAQRFQSALRDAGADDLAELGVRFALSHPDISTVLVGFSDLAQIEAAARAAERGALPHPPR